jgi:plastocyanin
VAALAAVAILVAACQSGGPGAPLPTMPTENPAQSVNRLPSAAVSPAGPAASVTVTASASPATRLPSPSAPATAASPASTAPSLTTAPSVAAPSPTARSGGPSSPSTAAVDPRVDGLDVTCGDVAIALEAAVIRPGPVTLIVHNAGRSTAGFEMKSARGGGSGGDGGKIETRTFAPGETLRVEANLAPGVYEAECSGPDRASDGLRTALEVRADAALVAPSAGTTAAGRARIVQFAFVAATLDVRAGARVTWTNEDPTPHTVTADHGAFDSRQLDPGASFSVVLATPGTYSYHCDIHRTMVGSVVVH